MKIKDIIEILSRYPEADLETVTADDENSDNYGMVIGVEIQHCSGGEVHVSVRF